MPCDFNPAWLNSTITTTGTQLILVGRVQDPVATARGSVTTCTLRVSDGDFGLKLNGALSL